MEKVNVTKREYLKKYANNYCEGDTEKASEHAIVKEVFKYLGDENERD